MSNVLNEHYGMLNDVSVRQNLLQYTNEQQQIPSYEQVMKGAKTRLLSTANSASIAMQLTVGFNLLIIYIKIILKNTTTENIHRLLPPSYSNTNIATQTLFAQADLCNDNELNEEDQAILRGYSDSGNEGDIPPPVYEDNESNRINN